MKLTEVLTPSFRSLHKTLITHHSSLVTHHSSLICLTADSDFCHEAVQRGWLTSQQMDHAARRYRLGRSRSGRTIFWIIDQQGHIRDGRIGTSWVSTMLKNREPQLLRDWHPQHCLYGLHLLSAPSSVAVVEREEAAVVLSELLPGHLWLATGHALRFKADWLLPLKGCQVTLFPATDPTMDNFICWLEMADSMNRQHRMDITVSPILEDHATPEQKQRRIDLLTYLADST